MMLRNLTLGLCATALLFAGLSASARPGPGAGGALVPAAPAAPVPAPADAAPGMLPPMAAPVPAALPVVPAAPIPSASLPTVPAAPAPSVNATLSLSAAPGVAASSMGTSTLSVLFAPNQINAMRDALSGFESHRTDANTSEVAVVTVPINEQKAIEPDPYPVFYLSSIVYHSPVDWSLWVSGRKITSTKNPTTLKVLAVAPDHATFSWTPSFSDAINQRRAKNLFAPTDPIKNKLTSAPSFSYNEKTGTVTFTLLINQSFVAAYFNTFEGFVDSPKLPPIDPAAPAAGTPGATVPQAANAGAPPSDMKSGRPANSGLADDSINALLDHVK